MKMPSRRQLAVFLSSLCPREKGLYAGDCAALYSDLAFREIWPVLSFLDREEKGPFWPVGFVRRFKDHVAMDVLAFSVSDPFMAPIPLVAFSAEPGQMKLMTSDGRRERHTDWDRKNDRFVTTFVEKKTDGASCEGPAYFDDYQGLHKTALRASFLRARRATRELAL